VLEVWIGPASCCRSCPAGRGHATGWPMARQRRRLGVFQRYKYGNRGAWGVSGHAL